MDKRTHTLQLLFNSAPEMTITDKDRFVIFSDLHMGDGSTRDDFSVNASLFSGILQKYYLEHDYTLILNGDVEELQKFSLQSIINTWNNVYSVFSMFSKREHLIKIIGNHDLQLLHEKHYPIRDALTHALRLSFNDNTLFIFHGHQASNLFENYNNLLGYVFKYLAKPFGVKNFSSAYNSKRRFRIERRVYKFSTSKKIVSIIGHTHRPLFESLSKVDYLKYKIEHLCRQFPLTEGPRRQNIRSEINSYREELEHSLRKKKRMNTHSSLYNNRLTIPSIFNSGCVIGKRGITALEIHDGKISLVQWFDSTINRKYFYHEDRDPEQLRGTNYFRKVLKDDYLSYIFSRIELLS